MKQKGKTGTFYGLKCSIKNCEKPAQRIQVPYSPDMSSAHPQYTINKSEIYCIAHSVPAKIEKQKYGGIDEFILESNDDFGQVVGQMHYHSDKLRMRDFLKFLMRNADKVKPAKSDTEIKNEFNQHIDDICRQYSDYGEDTSKDIENFVRIGESFN